MKHTKFLTLLILLLSGTNMLGGPAELIFMYNHQNSTEAFTIELNVSGFFWSWDQNDIMFLGDNSTFPRTYQNAYNYKFDSPKDHAILDPQPIMPWGLMHFAVTWDSAGTPKTVNFTIDFRDEDWSLNAAKYGGGYDLYIKIDSTASWQGLIYTAQKHTGAITGSIVDGRNYTIWGLWRNSTANQENFSFPATMKNRVEGQSDDFGQLQANGETINSGGIANLNGASYNTVAHSTVEKLDGQQRFYSFKWDYENLSPTENQNLYSSSNNIVVDFVTEDREVKRNFHEVYPLTIKNVLTENGGVTVDEIYFKDPTDENEFELKSASGNGYVNNEAFDSLSIAVDGQLNQKYSVKAKESFAYNGRNYYWFGGDFSPTYYGTDLLITGQTNLNANYKGTQLSNSTGAFASGSQRKFVKTNPTTTYTNGVLHMVYESLGSVWYEHSTDNGQTWIVADGEPVATNAQNPSIAVQNNSTDTDRKAIVVYESGSFIKYGLYINGHKASSASLEEGSVSNPVVAWSGDDKIVIAYELDLESASSGLYFNVAHFTALNTIAWAYPFNDFGITGRKVSNTGQNSLNPTITNQDSSVIFHLAWQESTTSIKYIRMSWNGTKKIMSFSNYAEPSYGAIGYSNNFKPSISMYDEYPALVWIRENTGTQITECALKIYFYPYNWSSFYSYGYGGGYYVDMVNINKGDNYNFILAWSGDQQYDKYLKSNSATTTYSLSTSGDAQVSNGNGFSDMRIQSFDKYNSPYDFTISGTNGMLKTNASNNELVARQFDLLNDDINVQAGISEIIVDGERIPFVGEDSFIQDPTLDFDSKLETESFTLTNNSEFTFSFNHDASVITPAALSTNNNVKIKVMLVDAQTDETIGVLHENIIDGTQQILSGVNNFLVNTSGIGEREVKLAINVTDKLKTESNYTVTTRIISEGGELEKANYEEINYTGESPVSEYALAQNYPNPFNPSTRISYQIPSDGNVSLKIYDVLGAEVMTLVKATQAQGRYEVSFDASQLSSGVYIYRIQANDYVASRKMMLLK